MGQGSGSGAGRTGFPSTTPVFDCSFSCGNGVVQPARDSAPGRRPEDTGSTSTQQLPRTSKLASPAGDASLRQKRFLFGPCTARFSFSRKREMGGAKSCGSLPQNSRPSDGAISPFSAKQQSHRSGENCKIRQIKHVIPQLLRGLWELDIIVNRPVLYPLQQVA